MGAEYGSRECRGNDFAPRPCFPAPHRAVELRPPLDQNKVPVVQLPNSAQHPNSNLLSNTLNCKYLLLFHGYEWDKTFYKRNFDERA